MKNFKEFLNKSLKKAASVAIFNPQNKILLVRRSKTAEWMPLHYCLPGGHMEEKETPVDTAEREVFEETGIELNKHDLKLIDTQINNNYINYLYAIKINNSKVHLNNEHDKFVWCSFEDCQEYNLVPKLHYFIKELKNKGYFE
jgi:8-oxo-dGTP pyrophosphatase MutT (NUDIX family)